MASYVLSPLAEKDLEGIFEYTAREWGLAQLEVYRDKLISALARVTDDPGSPGSRARDDLFPGCRTFRVEHHYLVYRRAAAGIEVGRILHERMKFEWQVPGEEVFGEEGGTG